MSLLDEEFHWFFCGDEGSAVCHGPYRSRQTCEQWAGDDTLCLHDRGHLVFASTGRRLVDSLPLNADYWLCAFYLTQGDDYVELITSRLSDVGHEVKMDLYDEMADLLKARASSTRAAMASALPDALL